MARYQVFEPDTVEVADLEPYFLTVQGASARAGGETISQLSDDGPEIVVIGNPSRNLNLDWLYRNFLPGMTFPSAMIPNFSIDPPSLFQQRLRLAKDAFIVALAKIEQDWKTQSADNDFGATVRDDLGDVFYINEIVSQVRQDFIDFDYNIIENLVLRPGYGGFTLCDGGRCFSNIAAETLVGYWSTWSNIGLEYLSIHELAHNFAEMKAYEYRVAATYLNADRREFDENYALSPQFARIERATNTIAKAILSSLGKPLPANVPFPPFE